MKKTGLFLTLAVVSTTSFADVKSNEVKTEVKETKKKYERVVVDESRANRDGKQYTLNAAITGYSFGAASNSIEAGYHLDADKVISLQYSDLKNGTGDDKNSEDEVDRLWAKDGVGSAISVNFKNFVSNSFYIKPGVYYRDQTKVEETTSSFGELLSSKYSEFKDMGVEFRIGNQWQFENFTLGADWVGITRTLNIMEQKGTYKYSAEDLSAANLLNFYLGYTF